MFKLSENYEVDRRILKCDYIRYSPSEISTINTPKSQIYINIPRGDSVNSFVSSYVKNPSRSNALINIKNND